MNAKKTCLSILTMVGFSLLFYASISGSKEAAKPPTLVPMKFDYSTPGVGVTKSNDIKFALINPRFVTSFEQSKIDPYKTFANSMGDDFVEMLTARGYPYVGPYNTIDDMVYSEKQTTDLVLEVEVDLQFTGNAIKQTSDYEILTSRTNYYYIYNGDMNLSGKITMIFSEPFTKTKVWVKSVSTEPITFFLDSQYKYKSKDIPVTDPKVWNTLVEILQKIYENVISTSWKYLEPEELKVKKSESLEIKKNSGFQKK